MLKKANKMENRDVRLFEKLSISRYEDSKMQATQQILFAALIVAKNKLAPAEFYALCKHVLTEILNIDPDNYLKEEHFVADIIAEFSNCNDEIRKEKLLEIIEHFYKLFVNPPVLPHFNRNATFVSKTFRLMMGIFQTCMSNVEKKHEVYSYMFGFLCDSDNRVPEKIEDMKVAELFDLFYSRENKEQTMGWLFYGLLDKIFKVDEMPEFAVQLFQTCSSTNVMKHSSA